MQSHNSETKQRHAAVVPFTDEVIGGLQEMEGLLRVDGGNLLLEFQVKDGIVGLLKSKVRTVTVPLSQIESVALKDGWFGSRLTIRAATLQALEEIPTNRHGQVRLAVARSDRSRAREVVSELSAQLGERVSPSSRPRWHVWWDRVRDWLEDV